MVDFQKIGIAFSGGASPSEIVDCVKLAESLGYESAWVAEGHGGDQFAVLAACAAQTSRILLGTSITSVFVRTAPTIAMAAMTVDDLSRGRFILGVGSSHKVQVEGEHGVPYAMPLTRVRETVELIRRLAQDGRVSFRGETVRVENFDLWFTPWRRAFPIYWGRCRQSHPGARLGESRGATAWYHISRGTRTWTRFVSMQNLVNLLYREEEREMLPLCAAEGIGVIPWSPQARGKLSRRFVDTPRGGVPSTVPRWRKPLCR